MKRKFSQTKGAIRQRQWRKDHPGKQNEYDIKYHQHNPERYLWMVAKTRAKKQNQLFTITIEDVIIPDSCPYRNVKLEVKKGVGRRWDAPSIDRIDNTKGYIPGNVEVISWKANAMKGNLTPLQMKHFAEQLLARYREVG